MLVVDIQEGLFQVVHDMEPRAFRNNIFAFSQLGVYFDLPTIITTSAETGPNGPVPPEILADHPKAPYIKRKGEVNAWDSKVRILSFLRGVVSNLDGTSRSSATPSLRWTRSSSSSPVSLPTPVSPCSRSVSPSANR